MNAFHSSGPVKPSSLCAIFCTECLSQLLIDRFNKLFVIALDVESAGVSGFFLIFRLSGLSDGSFMEGNIHGVVLNSRFRRRLCTRDGHSRRHLGDGSDDPSGSDQWYVACLPSFSGEHG